MTENDSSSTPPRSPAEVSDKLEQALFEIRRMIAGQDAMLERVLVCLLSQGHLLIEGVPGLAKTLTIKTTASVLGGSFARVQFTPDLVPADLVGTRIYRPDKGEFDTELGPVFCNFLLADEINRAPAKVQSALLEVMQERQVTIAHTTYPVPEPFLVLATQNPIESEGTYPLPEAQVDRFMLKILIGYPEHDEELTIVQRQLDRAPGAARGAEPRRAARRCRSEVATIYVDPALVSYAVTLASATRDPAASGSPTSASYVEYGASPRGPIVAHAVGARARAAARPRLRDRRGRARARQGRAPPPARPQLPGAGRERQRGRDPRPRARRGSGSRGELRAAVPPSRERSSPAGGDLPAALLRALQLDVGRRIDGLLAGEFRSSRHGEGTELAQLGRTCPATTCG